MVYFVLAHPSLNISRANAAILKAARERSGRYPDRLLICDLYQEYHDFHIDVASEQSRLKAAQVIFIQHPFFWYNMPPLLKLWFDAVWLQGFAYGPGGEALKGKSLQLSITTGGAEQAYRPEGANRHTVEQFNINVEQTARLCGMNYLAPIVLHSANRAAEADLEKHALDVVERLCLLVEGTSQ